MSKQIRVNGQWMEVRNTFSVGPGEPPHTYVLRGLHVYEVSAGRWMSQTAGQYPVACTVKV